LQERKKRALYRQIVPRVIALIDLMFTASLVSEIAKADQFLAGFGD
jgi:hypothetical protein